jgi:hypothetical protein
MSSSMIGFVALLLMLAGSVTAAPVETAVTVRVQSHDAKFIGSGVGEMAVIIEDADSGALLASGRISGATGDTDRLMRTPLARGTRLADDDSAGFTARLMLERPTRVRIRALGPLAVADARQEVALTTWVLPGKSIDGDGIVLRLPGLIVAARPALAVDGRVPLAADVTLMCGCPITAGGLWDAADYTVGASLRRDGELVGETTLAFSGEPNLFAGELPAPAPGRIEVTLWAHNANTGNSGVSRYTLDLP